MKSKILGILALGLLGGSMATAAPVAYDESVSGDIPGDGTFLSVTTMFMLDAGVNTVTGTQSGSGDGADVVFDVDPFRFVVPVGAELFSFSLAWNNSKFINIRSGGISSCNLFDSAFSLIDRVGSSPRCVDVTTDPTGSQALFSSSLPLAAGTYAWLGGAGTRFAAGGPWSWSVDYVLSMGLRSVPTSVPEPGSLALLGLGLVGLGLSRRRKAA